MSDQRRTGPKGSGADVRKKLLEAGCAIYEERGLDGAALREVADRAGVNQAMVRYYFSDKMGFETALLDEGFDRLFEALPDSGDFTAKFQAATSALNSMAWLPLLMLRTVYVDDRLRQHFMATHAPKMVSLLASGLDHNSPFHLLSALSLLVFPHLARPIAGPVLGVTFDDKFAGEFAEHVGGLLNEQGQNNV